MRRRLRTPSRVARSRSPGFTIATVADACDRHRRRHRDLQRRRHHPVQAAAVSRRRSARAAGRIRRRISGAGRPAVQRGLNYPEHQGWRDRVEDDRRERGDHRHVAAHGEDAGRRGGPLGRNGVGRHRSRCCRRGRMLGRTLQPADDANPTVVVLSHDTWQRHYHSDPSIVGTLARSSDGRAAGGAIPPMFLTVVGVLPAGFEFPTGTLDFVMPIALDPSRPPPGATTIARLAPGVSLEAATQEANAMGTAMRPPGRPTAMPPTGPRFEYQCLKERLVAPLRPGAARASSPPSWSAADRLRERRQSDARARHQPPPRDRRPACRRREPRADRSGQSCSNAPSSRRPVACLARSLGAAGVVLVQTARDGRGAGHLPPDVRRQHPAARE